MGISELIGNTTREKNKACKKHVINADRYVVSEFSRIWFDFSSWRFSHVLFLHTLVLFIFVSLSMFFLPIFFTLDFRGEFSNRIFLPISFLFFLHKYFLLSSSFLSYRGKTFIISSITHLFISLISLNIFLSLSNYILYFPICFHLHSP